MQTTQNVIAHVKAHLHNAIFLIATAILLFTMNGLCKTQWKCSHSATVTTSNQITDIDLIRKNRTM